MTLLRNLNQNINKNGFDETRRRNIPIEEERKIDERVKSQMYQNIPKRDMNQTQRIDTTRTNMSGTTWGVVFSVTEILGDIIKAIVLIGGILACNAADVIMGTIAVSLLMAPNASNIISANLGQYGFGSILSLGASSIQIFMWSVLMKRGITIKQIWNFKRLPKDIQAFLAGALLIWTIDTFLDMSPVFVLFRNTNYTGHPTLYFLLVLGATVILFLMCGLAEVLTSNMRKMFNAG